MHPIFLMKSKPLKERNTISYIFCITYHFQGKTDLGKGIQETFSHLITFWKMLNNHCWLFQNFENMESITYTFLPSESGFFRLE